MPGEKPRSVRPSVVPRLARARQTPYRSSPSRGVCRRAPNYKPRTTNPGMPRGRPESREEPRDREALSADASRPRGRRAPGGVGGSVGSVRVARCPSLAPAPAAPRRDRCVRRRVGAEVWPSRAAAGPSGREELGLPDTGSPGNGARGRRERRSDRWQWRGDRADGGTGRACLHKDEGSSPTRPPRAPRSLPGTLSERSAGKNP